MIFLKIISSTKPGDKFIGGVGSGGKGKIYLVEIITNKGGQSGFEWCILFGMCVNVYFWRGGGVLGFLICFRVRRRIDKEDIH